MNVDDALRKDPDKNGCGSNPRARRVREVGIRIWRSFGFGGSDLREACGCG